MDSYRYGCRDCDWWDESSEPDFGNCPSCGQPKEVWNQTDAEAPTDHELALEESIASNLNSQQSTTAQH